MTASGALSPIRRSALSRVHRELGARFVDGGEWPETYGDVQAEREAVRRRAGLLDVGPLDKVSLSGELRTAGEPGPRFDLGRITSGDVDGRPAQLWGLTDDEGLLVAPGLDARSSVSLAAALATATVATTDVSSLYAVLRLAGPRARAILEELFPEDVSHEALPDRAIAFGPLANVTVTLGRIDDGGLTSFFVLCERDHAEYLWEALLRIGERHGLRAVGAAAFAED